MVQVHPGRFDGWCKKVWKKIIFLYIIFFLLYTLSFSKKVKPIGEKKISYRRKKGLSKKMKSSKKQKVYITLGSPVVPLLSTYKADSNLTSECWRDQVFYATYERIQRKEIKVEYMNTSINVTNTINQAWTQSRFNGLVVEHQTIILYTLSIFSPIHYLFLIN